MRTLMTRRLRKKRAFRMLALSYAAFIAVSLVFAFISHTALLKTVTGSATERSVSQLSQAAQSVEMYFAGIENTMINLAANQDVLTYIYRNQLENGKDYYRMYTAQKEISDAAVQNIDMYLLGVYTSDTGRIVYSASCRTAEDFYNSFLKYEGMTAGEWSESLDESALYTVTGVRKSAAGGRKLIEFVMPITAAGKKARIVAYMDAQLIENVFKAGDMPGDGALRIEKGEEILFEIGNYKEADSDAEETHWQKNEDGSVLYVTLTSSGGRTYRWMLSENNAVTEIPATRAYILRMLIFELAGGILLSLTMIYFNYSPLHRVLKQLSLPGGAAGDKNEYEHILSAADDMLKKNQSLAGKLENQIPMLRKSLLGQLITTDACPGRETLEEYGIRLPEKYFAVAVVHVDGGREMRALIMYSVMNLIENRFAGRMALNCVECTPRAFALFMNPSEPDVSALLYEISSFLKNDMHAEAVIGVGGTKETLESVNTAYTEATEALLHALSWQEKGIVFYEDIGSFSTGEVFTAGAELELLTALRAGSDEHACAVLNRLFDKVKNSPASHVEIMVYGIVTACLRLLCEWKISVAEADESIVRLTEHISRNSEISVIREEAGRMTEIICAAIRSMKNTNTSNIGEEALKIIEEKYSEEDFSLTTAAEILKLSPPYLSHVFKQQTGESFVNALNRVRLEHACMLLKTTDSSVSTVSGMCGYTDAGYFNRVFKKKFGVTPGQFRGES